MWIKTTDGRYLNADKLPSIVRRDIYDGEKASDHTPANLTAVQIVAQYDQDHVLVLANIPTNDPHAPSIEEHFAVLDNALSQPNSLCDFFGLTPGAKFGHTVPGVTPGT